MKTRTNILVCAVPVLALLACSALASAGMAVSPLKQEISLRPGEEGKVTITLTNQTRSAIAQAQSAKLCIVDVQATEEGSLMFKPAGAMATSASRWVTLPQTDVALEPNQSLPIVCTIKPPLSAAPGEYYAVVLVTLDMRGRTDRGVSVQYRVASGIFVTVQGRALPRQAKIARADILWPAPTTAPSTQPADPPRVSAVLQNTGQARFDAVGKLTIIDSRHRVVLSRPLQSKRACVFGGDSRLFEAPIDKALAPGVYKARVDFDYGSTWSRARYEVAMYISPEQSDLLSLAKQRLRAGKPPVDVLPEKIAITMPAGATRSLALALKNIAESPAAGTASLESADAAQAADDWIALEPAEFSIVQSARKSVEVKVHVPPGTPAGRYSSIVNITAGLEGAPPRQVAVPIEIDVRTER